MSQKAFAKMPGLACKEGLNLPMVMYIFGGQKMKQYTSNKTGVVFSQITAEKKDALIMMILSE